MGENAVVEDLTPGTLVETIIGPAGHTITHHQCTDDEFTYHHTNVGMTIIGCIEVYEDRINTLQREAQRLQDIIDGDAPPVIPVEPEQLLEIINEPNTLEAERNDALDKLFIHYFPRWSIGQIVIDQSDRRYKISRIDWEPIIQEFVIYGNRWLSTQKWSSRESVLEWIRPE